MTPFFGAEKSRSRKAGLCIYWRPSNGGRSGKSPAQARGTRIVAVFNWYRTKGGMG